MSKQIYIDSNGNEVLVSGTITNAGNLPLGSDFSDPTSTAGAIANCVRCATFDFDKAINATTQATYYIARTDFPLPTRAKVKSAFLRERTSSNVNAGGLVYSAQVSESGTNAIEGTIYNGTNANRTYQIQATVLYTLA